MKKSQDQSCPVVTGKAPQQGVSRKTHTNKTGPESSVTYCCFFADVFTKRRYRWTRSQPTAQRSSTFSRHSIFRLSTYSKRPNTIQVGVLKDFLGFGFLGGFRAGLQIGFEKVWLVGGLRFVVSGGHRKHWPESHGRALSLFGLKSTWSSGMQDGCKKACGSRSLIS